MEINFDPKKSYSELVVDYSELENKLPHLSKWYFNKANVRSENMDDSSRTLSVMDEYEANKAVINLY